MRNSVNCFKRKALSFKTLNSELFSKHLQIMTKLNHSLFVLLIVFIECLHSKLNEIDESSVGYDIKSNGVESMFPEKPIQLVRPDDKHKKLVIVEENVKVILHLN